MGKLALPMPFTSFIEPRSIPHSLRNAVWAIPDCVLRCSARIFEREPRRARWPRVGVFLRPRRLSMSIIAQGLGFVKAEKCDFFRGRKPRNSRAQAGGLTSTREETARGNGCWLLLWQLFWLPKVAWELAVRLAGDRLLGLLGWLSAVGRPPRQRTTGWWGLRVGGLPGAA